MSRACQSVAAFLLVPAVWASVCVCAAGQAADHGLLSFQNVAPARGILPFLAEDNGHGHGASIADVDQDGDIDLFVPNRDGFPHQFYLNQDGQFVEMAAAVGLDVLEEGRCALFFDYDGDRDLDLVVGNDHDLATTHFRLYRQDPGLNFTDVTVQAGLVALVPGAHQGSFCAGDINNDGYLDLYAAIWRDDSFLFLNDTDGTFTDISSSSDINTGIGKFAWQPMMYDFDQDGWLDIYVAIDFLENALLINEHDNTFVDIAEQANADITFNDMGMCMGDYDGDGDLDVYTTNIFRTFQGEDQWSTLLRNDSTPGNVLFTEVAQAQGVDDGGYGWGATFFDADNDGDVDLAATNGTDNPTFNDDESRFWANLGQGPLYFSEDHAPRVGLNDTYIGSSYVAFDYDRDGDLDLLQSTLDGVIQLLENRPLGVPAPNGYLTIEPRMPGPNYRAIGAVVRLEAGGKAQMRLISCGTSFLGQEPEEAHFGLGLASGADQVTVEFPDGSFSLVEDLPEGQRHEILPPPLTNYVVRRGARQEGDTFSLLASDDDRLVLGGAGAPNLEVGFTTDVAAPSSVNLTVEAAIDASQVVVSCRLYNWTTSRHDEVGTLLLTPVDATLVITGLEATDYVRADGRLLVGLVPKLVGGPQAERVLRVDQVLLSVQ